MKRATIKDIAKAAGVSFVTVSKVLNNTGSISKKTSDKIRRLAREMNYIPDNAARALAKGRPDSIAIVTPSFTTGFMQQLFMGIQEEMLGSDKDVNFHISGMSGEDIEKSLNVIKHGKKAGSIIVISQQPDAAQIDGLVKAGIRVVLVEGKHPKAVMISADNENGAILAARRMVETGVKKPGLIIGDVKMINSQKERLAGFKKIFGNKFSIYELREHSFNDGIKAFRYLSNEGVDSVFCAAGDLVAYGFLFEAGRYNSRIKIIGFDDDQLSEGMGLTTVKQDVKGMGAAAFRAAANGPDFGVINFKTELIVRRT